jgi:hypothetical protein
LSDFRVCFCGGEDGFVFVVARPVLNLILGFLKGEWGVVYVEAGDLLLAYVEGGLTWIFTLK